MNPEASVAPSVARLTKVSLRYGKALALDGVTLEIPAGRMVGLIGPDGVGKSSLLALVAGARAVQDGRVEALGGDMAEARHREIVCPHISYMPQGLGKNLYPTLSVEENLQFFGRLFGHSATERRWRIDELARGTGLTQFLARPAGKLSGGMKQKLGLCCALIHDPDLLILDEPTTGVDPLARSQFWELIAHIRSGRTGMSVIVATAYMDEARKFDWLVAMDAGKVLATGTPDELLEVSNSKSLDAAFIALLPEERRRSHHEVVIPPLAVVDHEEIAIEATDLTMRFGDFTAVDGVSFRIQRGEIFGFIGSNGCGKSTTMKMLTGLLSPTSGNALLLGHEIDPRDLTTRRKVGYMSQSFSLYTELSVRQNLVLHARLFQVPEKDIATRVEEMVSRFELAGVIDSMPEALPLGIRQRLSLAVAMVHQPDLLILDEPTSGVDPIARDSLWQLMIDLARNDKVTVFISTHFMNEASRCDRISLMHAGKVLATAVPAELVHERGAESLEAAFISYLKEAEGIDVATLDNAPVSPTARLSAVPRRKAFSLSRAWSYTLRETLELKRDPMRGSMALLGSALLMLVFGYGINMDVENLNYAVLDRDQTGLSRSYALNLSGSRYFVERPPIGDYAELDRRMRDGELALAIEIPPEFARNVASGDAVAIGAWMDGAMPTRAETVAGYVMGMHQGWLLDMAKHQLGRDAGVLPATIVTRFRYNPDVKSLPAMVPAVIPMLLLMIPAMLTALSVVREKELGSIINLYVTPVTRSEFMLGKQMPYIVLGMINFSFMVLLAVVLFDVPLKGSFVALSAAAVLFVAFSTGFGLLASTFTRSQIAAMFVTIIGTMIPAVQFAGMMNPVSSLEGVGAFIGRIYPASHFLTISRGVFSKGLGFAGLQNSFWPLLLAVPVILGVSIVFLKKQET